MKTLFSNLSQWNEQLTETPCKTPFSAAGPGDDALPFDVEKQEGFNIFQAGCR
jgi:hypothetical protein